jgi:hypothetical protein
MDKNKKMQLMKFVYAVQNMGVSNTMIRNYFDPTNELQLYKPKNWLRFISEHINLIDNKIVKKQNNN